MLNSRFGYSMKKNSFKGLNIDCIRYSNIIRITYYSYSYSGTILNPNIIRICIRPNICARILFVFVFAHSEKRILFAFGPKSDSEYYLYSYSVSKTVFAHLRWGYLHTHYVGKTKNPLAGRRTHLRSLAQCQRSHVRRFH